MVTGVSTGFNKKLQISGVGYRAQLDGKDLVLNMGYSHVVRMVPPPTISINVENPTSIIYKWDIPEDFTSQALEERKENLS